MAASSWKDRLVSSLFVGLESALAKLPLAANQKVGGLIGGLLNMGCETKRITRINIRQAYPHLDTAALNILTKEALKETAKTATELGIMWCWPRERMEGLIYSVLGVELLHEARAQGRGVLVLAPHIGNWELLGWYLGEHFPTTSMYEPPYFRGIEAFMRHGRERSGAKLVPTNVRGVKALLDALRAGEVVGLLPDQAPDNGFVFADFFGRPARTMTLAQKLVQKTRPLVVVGSAIRRADGSGFDLHFQPGPALDVSDAEQAAHRLNQAVEACVALAPAQYQWTYKRWRKGPDTLPDLYSGGTR